ncbi:MAG: hypothetical protein GY941_16675 [Planctomycetes bacterium]|nr:hypothetical protein [Planctomycetota bacterium]
MPRNLTYAVSQNMADLSYIFYKRAAKNVKLNLKLVFPSYSDKKRALIARDIFRNYSKYLVDYCRFTNLQKSSVIEQIACYEGKEFLEKALGMNKGLILLTAHLGNWELGGIFFGSMGVKTNVLTLPDENLEIDNIRRRYRELFHVNTIIVGNSPLSSIDMVRALNNREAIAMLIDRNRDELESIEMDFFKRPTSFPRGPFILSRLTGAPILMAFVVRENGVYKGIIESPLLVQNKEDEYYVLEKVVQSLEKCVSKYPDQWYNFTMI